MAFTEFITISLDEPTRLKLEDMARQTEQSMGEIIRVLIQHAHLTGVLDIALEPGVYELLKEDPSRRPDKRALGQN